MSMEELEKILKKLGVGRRPINDPFFDNTYKVCKVFEKKGVVCEDEEELCHPLMKEFQCNACNAVFENLLDYELHYHDAHHFFCAQCKKWKPTARLLEIHIQETHDSYFKVLAEKQPMYECFVSFCETKFKTPEERTQHTREIHKFPKNYRFDESARKKKVKENKPSIETEENKSSMEVEENKSSMEVEENEPSKKKNLHIHFGKHLGQKTFMKKNSKIKSTDVKSDNSQVESIDIKSDNSQVESTDIKSDNSQVQSTDVKSDNSKTQQTFSPKPATMFIPRQVQQKSYAKALTQNKKMERNVLEAGTLMELEKSLPTN